MVRKRVVFAQDPALSRSSVTLDCDKITITRHGIGVSDETVVRISEIDPKVEVTDRRIVPLYFFPLFYFILIMSTAFWLARVNIVPVEVGLILALSSLAFVGPTLKGLRPVEVTVYRGRNGKMLFELFKPRKSSPSYDEFIAALATRLGHGRE